MKRFLLILSLGIVCFTSCEQPTMLSINQTALTFDNGGGNQSVAITANKMWKASSNQGWCKVSPSSGDGSDNSNITLSVSCDANDTYDERTATITIYCGELTQTISVSQSEGKGLIISQTEYNLTNAEQTISVEVKANVQYSVEIDYACRNWIKQESTKGLSSNIIKFVISKNEGFDGREGKITIKQKDGSMSGTVVVKQSQLNGLFISTPEYTLSNEKHSLTVEVKSNVEFDVTPKVDWIKYVETKGLKTSQIVFEVSANDGYDKREGTVVVKQKNGDLSGIITIHQEENYGIIVSQTDYSLSNEASTVDVEVKYNVDFDVVIPDACKDWVSVVGTKGLSSRTYTISIAKNETYDNRECSITFKQKNGSLSGTVVIRQSQTDGLIAEKKEYKITAEEQLLDIKVKSNIAYEVLIDDACKDWISLVQTKGLIENTVTLFATTNEGDVREGKVRFTSENLSEEIVIIQEAERYVVFDDMVFKAHCIAKYDKNGDGRISLSEASKVTSLGCSGMGIKSLVGIEDFVNLQFLNCDGNELTCLDISNNKALSILYCGNCSLSEIDVSNNSALSELYCWRNQLKEIDLSHNTALTLLCCHYNQLTSLDVSNCPALGGIECYENNLTTIEVCNGGALRSLQCWNNSLLNLDVSDCAALISLRCHNNQLQTLNASNCTSLTELWCQLNQLQLLNVENCISLTELYCDFNKLESLDVSDCVALKSLTCTSNNLKTLNACGCTELTGLTCEYNSIQSLDVRGCVNLGTLICRYNKIQTLDLSGCPSLGYLMCNNNQIEFLDISTAKALTKMYCDHNQLRTLCINSDTLDYLDCHYNKLQTLEINGNRASLATLICNNNELKSLDVSGFTALNELICYSNPLLQLNVQNCSALKHLEVGSSYQCMIDELDLSDCVALSFLDCQSSQLKSLIISKCTSLTELYCQENQIESLDVSNCTKLTDLGCYSNQLKTLDVSNCSKLKSLNCTDNPLLLEIIIKKGQRFNRFWYDTDIATIKYVD